MIFFSNICYRKDRKDRKKKIKKDNKIVIRIIIKIVSNFYS